MLKPQLIMLVQLYLRSLWGISQFTWKDLTNNILEIKWG